MSDIFREVDEDLRRDRLEKIWERYGAAIVGAVLVIVAGTAGLGRRLNHQHTEAETETAQLADALRLAGNSAGQVIRQQYQRRSQSRRRCPVGLRRAERHGAGHPARFFEAGLRAREGDNAAAIKIYDELTQSAKLEPVYRDLATVLSVMHQVQTGDPANSPPVCSRLPPTTTPGAIPPVN